MAIAFIKELNFMKIQKIEEVEHEIKKNLENKDYTISE